MGHISFRKQAVLRDETTGMYSLASEEDSQAALDWVLAARTRQLQKNQLSVGCMLPPALLKVALGELLADFARSPANRPCVGTRAHDSSTTTATAASSTAPARKLKSIFKAMCHMVFGDQIVVMTILVHGRYGPDLMAELSEKIREARAQRRCVPKTQQAATRRHQQVRKLRNSIRNTLLARGVNLDGQRVAASADGACSSYHGTSSFSCPRCGRALCTSCSRQTRQTHPTNSVDSHMFPVDITWPTHRFPFKATPPQFMNILPETSSRISQKQPQDPTLPVYGHMRQG
jgi:hypothetical protein